MWNTFVGLCQSIPHQRYHPKATHTVAYLDEESPNSPSKVPTIGFSLRTDRAKCHVASLFTWIVLTILLGFIWKISTSEVCSELNKRHNPGASSARRNRSLAGAICGCDWTSCAPLRSLQGLLRLFAGSAPQGCRSLLQLLTLWLGKALSLRKQYKIIPKGAYADVRGDTQAYQRDWSALLAVLYTKSCGHPLDRYLVDGGKFVCLYCKEGAP